jgi:enoyl-CoA hydratase/carnithine racemase
MDKPRKTFLPLILTCIGNAIGFGVTTLALCDVIYSVPQATFVTPFMKLAFCAEGCSSILFPRIMGPSKANEMLVTYIHIYTYIDLHVIVSSMFIPFRLQ